MVLNERNNNRKISYHVDEFDYPSDSDDEDSEEKNYEQEEKEEIYGWDLFRHFPPKIKTGSNADTSIYDLSLQIIKCLTYIVLFILTIFGGVLSKLTILLATSQIEKTQTVPYCIYNEAEKRPSLEKITTIIPEESRLTWWWCIILSFSFAEGITLLNTFYYILFKKKKFPNLKYLLFVCLLEIFHTIGMAILFLVILPKLDTIQAVTVSSCTCFIPSILGLLSRNKQQEGSKNVFIFLLIGDILALIGQLSGIIFLPILSEINNTDKWLLPCVLILSSCRWWPNFVSPKSKIGFINFLSKIKDDLEISRGIVQGITAILRISTFLLTALMIIHWNNIDQEKFFNCLPGNIKFNLYLNVTNKLIGSTNEDSTTPLVIFLINAFASFITYSCGKFSSRTLMQRFGFALPISLVLPSTILAIFILSNIYEINKCAFHDLHIPSYIFFKETKKIYNINDFIKQWEKWLWIPWLMSQAWITMHIWTPYCERLATSDRIFAVSSYDSLIIDQSLMLNRRKDDAPENPADIEGFRPEDTCGTYSTRHSDTLSSTIKPGDRVTRIYACATMWHELQDEMMQLISSILRLDLCQSAMRFTQKRYRIQIDDYYELETHIFFDDAFQCMYGCTSICNHDENETKVNCYVKTLIECMKISVERLGMLASPPMKYPAPYGGRLEWKLPGQTKLIAHLKDKNKIRHRKRWSQVMYMYYLLGYRLMDRSIHKNRKEIIAENTYILTLDGDIDFHPSAVKVLLHLMKRDKSLGAACGRIHPVGSGPMVWFQKFEYAIGHWLQKSTEHMMGSVLCSPGCFSLFRAKALMEDNVMRKYATRSTDARHYVQYDQGEDRWLCTLVLQSGYRVEYSAASDSYTHAPETFNEFYNQRRRWIPSTLLNIFDLLNTSKETREANENISRPYIAYQWVLMGSTILGPGTIFLMLVGAFVAAFNIDNWTSLYYNLIPIGIFVIICFSCKAKLQLFVAAVISAIYGLVMIVVLVGIMLQIAEDGWTAPSTILFFAVVGQLIITGILHPNEWGCLICGLIYYITVPSMYLLLIIFSLFSINNVTWGTREQKPIDDNNNINNNEKILNNKLLLNKKNKSIDNGIINFSFAGLFKCIFCTNNQLSNEDIKLNIITNKLDNINERLDKIEKNIDSNDSCQTSQQTIIQDDKLHHDDDDDDDDIQLNEINENKINDLTIMTNVDLNEYNYKKYNNKLCNFLVSPTWLQDNEISKGGIEFLSHEEEVFWNRLITKYLYPIDEDKKQLEKTSETLKELRNEYLFKFFMINALFVLIVFLMQLKKNILHINWPFGATYNITYNRAMNEVHIDKDYLQLEPIGCLFIIGFVLILFVQFVAMLFHRFETFHHILANTPLKIFRWNSKSNTTELSLDEHVEDLVDGLQKIAEENANPVSPKTRQSIGKSPGKRQTVHELIENNDKKVKIPANFDTVFRQNIREKSDNPRLTSSGISQNVLKAFERRRTTFVAHQRKSQFQRTNSEHIYQSPTDNQPEINKSYSYDNPSFIQEENEEIEPSLPKRTSQIQYSNPSAIP